MLNCNCHHNSDGLDFNYWREGFFKIYSIDLSISSCNQSCFESLQSVGFFVYFVVIDPFSPQRFSSLWNFSFGANTQFVNCIQFSLFSFFPVMCKLRSHCLFSGFGQWRQVFDFYWSFWRKWVWFTIRAIIRFISPWCSFCNICLQFQMVSLCY